MKHYPVVAWPGGKRRLAKVLLPIINSRPHSCYVEEFAGGASMFFLRHPAEVEVLNDVNGEIINLYRVIKNHLDEFAKQFRFMVSSRQLFEWNKETPPHVLTDIQRAAVFSICKKRLLVAGYHHKHLVHLRVNHQDSTSFAWRRILARHI